MSPFKGGPRKRCTSFPPILSTPFPLRGVLIILRPSQAIRYLRSRGPQTCPEAQSLVTVFRNVLSMRRYSYFMVRSAMGKSERNDRREGKHEPGSWIKKRGPKGKRPVKEMSPGKLQKHRALEEARWKRKIPKLIASLALEPPRA